MIRRPTSRMNPRDLGEFRQIRHPRSLARLPPSLLVQRPRVDGPGHGERDRLGLHHVLRARGHRYLLEKVGDVRLEVRPRLVHDILRELVVSREVLRDPCLPHEQGRVRGKRKRRGTPAALWEER